MTHDIKHRIEVVERMIQLHRDRYDDILARYGSGVRPAYVSEDLAYEDHFIGQYVDELADLQAELEATNADS